MARAAKQGAPKSAYQKAEDQAFSEVFHDVPESVVKTGKTGESRRKMMVAISLSKARAAVKKRG